MHFARPDPHYIQQLEAAATRNPRWCRCKVTALALWGDFMLTTAQLLPVLLPVGIGLIVLNSAVSNPMLFNIAGGVVLVLLVWLTRPDARFTGAEIKPADAPEFFQALDALRTKLDVAPRMRVMIDDEFNASAGETRNVRYPMQFAVLRIGHGIMRQSGTTEDEVVERYSGYVHTLLPANTLVAFSVVFSTETPARRIAELLSKLPAACCYCRE